MKKEKMKGQMSLEMIIGMLILLVVAAVIIKMFLGSVGDIGSISDLKNANQYKDFVQQCESLCDQYKAVGTRAAAAKYCYTRFKGATNLKQNLLNKPIESDTKVGLKVCPDAIYCFHAQECQTDVGVIDWSDCRAVLCQAYVDTYNDYGKASQKVSELIPSSGSCALPQNENWYTLFDFGPNPPCGGIVTTTTTTDVTNPSVTCSKASETTVTCNWSCPNTLTGEQYRLLVNKETQQLFTSKEKSGISTFTGLTSGTKYTIFLTCDIPDTQIYTSYPITI